MTFKFITYVGLCFVMSTSILFASNRLSIGTAVDFSSGYYGAEAKTEMIATIVQAKYNTDDFSIRLDLPYLTISGPSNVTTSSSSTVIPTTSTKYRESEGIGDAVLGVVYNTFYNPEFAFAIDVGFKLKMPTASHHAGLGTGEPDETLQIYTYKSLDDFTLMLGAGYKFVGEPTNTHYRNTASVSSGIIYQLSNQSSIGTMVDFRQSVFSKLNNQTEVTLYGSHKFLSSWQTQLYLYKGLTNTSPSFGVGGVLSYQF